MLFRSYQHQLGEKKAQHGRALSQYLQSRQQQLQTFQIRLDLLDPKLVLERGFAWISDHQGQAVSSVKQVSAGQSVQATLADGVLDLTVKSKP